MALIERSAFLLFTFLLVITEYNRRSGSFLCVVVVFTAYLLLTLCCCVFGSYGVWLVALLLWLGQ